MTSVEFPALGLTDVELLERQMPFRGFFKVERFRLRHARFGGGKTDVFDREVFIRPDAVCVLLYDPKADAVVLLEQFRAGPFAHGGENPFCVSLVAGMYEPDENPEDAARRETKEEAGLDISGRLEKIVEYFPSPGGCTERIHVYCAEIDSTKAGGIFGLDSEHEDIRALVVPFDQSLDFMVKGRTAASDVLIGLLWLTIHRDRLRRDWR